MNRTLIALVASVSLFAAPAHAEENPAVVDALSGYMIGQIIEVNGGQLMP